EGADGAEAHNRAPDARLLGKALAIVLEQSTPESVEKSAERRNELIHRVGNLTLLTKELNPAVSNGPWLKKRDEMLKHTIINLNRPFLDVQVWNENGIEKRSATLFEVARKIWSRTAQASAASS